MSDRLNKLIGRHGNWVAPRVEHPFDEQEEGKRAVEEAAEHLSLKVN